MSDILRIRLPENLKDEVTNLYDNLGITLTQAVKMFLKQSVIDGGLPFQPHLDKRVLKKEVLEALKQSREDEKNGKLIKYENVEDLIADI